MRWTTYLAAAAIATLADASTLTPPVLPLLVRNPYLSTWLGNARGPPWEKWPIFWTGQEVCSHDSTRRRRANPSRSGCLFWLLSRNQMRFTPSWADHKIPSQALARTTISHTQLISALPSMPRRQILRTAYLLRAMHSNHLKLCCHSSLPSPQRQHYDSPFQLHT